MTSLIKESSSTEMQLIFYFFYNPTPAIGSLENSHFWWLESSLHFLSKHELLFHLSALSYSSIWLLSSLVSNKYIYRHQPYPLSAFCLARQKQQSISLSSLSGGSPVWQPLQLHLSAVIPVLVYFLDSKWQRLCTEFQIRLHFQACGWHEYFFFYYYIKL